MKSHLERELKMRADAGFHLPEMPGEPLPNRVFTSTYHDTAGRDLAAAGITLRHRVESGEGAWQLKLPHDDGRLELEVPGPAAAVPAELAGLLVAHTRGRKVEAVAALRTNRSGVLVRDGSLAVAEVTTDAVEVIDGRRVVRAFEELEIELVDGDEQALRQIERQLRDAGARDGDDRPKLFQALDLPREQPGNNDPHTPAERVRAGLASQRAAMLMHDPGVRLGRDIEDLHRMRVSVRRMRALLRAARPMLDRRWADRLRDQLGWLGTALGPARDFDVLIGHLQSEAAALDGDDQAAFAPVLERLEADGDWARARMLDALRSDRYLKLLEKLDRAVAEPRIVKPDIAAEGFARQEHARLARRIAALDDPPPDEQLHAARIAVKRARYAAELLGVDSRELRTYVTAARSLQDVLGAHQDACVAEQRLRELAQAFAATATHIACGRVIERERRRRLRQRAAFPDAWRTLAAAANAAFV
jgi:CHAD domain-containing protein